MAAFPNIDYSLARAGEEIMLVLQHREGRDPVVVTQLRPTVVWRCGRPCRSHSGLRVHKAVLSPRL